MNYKKLFTLILTVITIKPMEKFESGNLYDEVVEYIDTLLPYKDPKNFNKQIKSFLKDNGISPQERKALKTLFASRLQPEFHLVRTLACIKHLSCALKHNKATVAWVDDLDNTFNIYETSNPQETKRIADAHESVISSLSISNDQEYLVSCACGKGSDGLKIWQIAPKVEMLSTINYRKKLKNLNLPFCQNTILQAQLSPNNKFLACCDSDNNLVLLTIDLKNKTLNANIESCLIESFATSSNIIKFSPYAPVLLVLNDKQLCVYSVESKKLVSQTTIGEPSVNCSISPDFNFIACEHQKNKNSEHTVSTLKNDGTNHYAPLTKSPLNLQPSAAFSFDNTNNIIVMTNGCSPQCRQLHMYSNPFVLPDWTSLYDASSSNLPAQSFFNSVLVDQRKPYKIAIIYIPKARSFKDLYFPMLVQRAISKKNKNELQKIRANVDSQATSELWKRYIDNALQKIDEPEH